MRWFLVGLGVVALAACQYVPGTDDARIAEAQRAAAAQLKDPSSAQFRNVHLSETGWICGEMNGRNSFGAYSGFGRFVTSADGTVSLEPTGSSDDEKTALAYFEVIWSTCNLP